MSKKVLPVLFSVRIVEQDVLFCSEAMGSLEVSTTFAFCKGYAYFPVVPPYNRDYKVLTKDSETPSNQLNHDLHRRGPVGLSLECNDFSKP